MENSNLQLLNAVEVAKILNISKALAYRLIQQGDLPAVHINSSVRVRIEDLEKFIQKRLSQ